MKFIQVKTRFRVKIPGEITHPNEISNQRLFTEIHVLTDTARMYVKHASQNIS